MAVKIVISKPTYDATDSGLDVRNKIFDSELNHLKTFSSGTYNTTVASGGSSTLVVAHNLGYKPLVLAYFRNITTDPNKWFVTMTYPEVTNTRKSTNIQVSIGVNTTQLYIAIEHSAGGNRNIEVLYEIFYEGA